MPWKPSDAKRHDKDASGGKAARQWAHIANSALKRGDSEAVAIRKASGVVGKGSAMSALHRIKSK